MSKDRIRFGVIGTNWITEEFIKAGGECSGFILTAVYSRSEEQGRLFAQKVGAEKVYTDMTQFAADSDMDAVYIASPNSFHAEQAIRCMNSGKHVLCEKPIASNIREYQSMIDAARNNNVVLMEAMKSTLSPNFKMIKASLPKLGKLRRYFASYCQYSSRYDLYKQGELPNAFNPMFSNGALMDLGTYCIYPLVVLFGPPKKVQASGTLLKSGVDGAGSLILDYEDFDALIQYSKITDSYASAEIQGELGTLIFDKISRPDRAEIRYRNGSSENLTQPQNHDAMVYEVVEFMDLIRNGIMESTINSFENSMLTLEIMDEARRQIGLVFPADV